MKWNSIELNERLGTGFSSDVYKVKCNKGTSLALKIVDLDFERPPHNIKNEIKILEKVKGQSNVIEMINSESANGEYGIMFELYDFDLNYVLKSNLKKRTRFNNGAIEFEKCNKMKIDHCKNIMVGILSGLSWIHAKNVIHRDINPLNVMFKNGSELNGFNGCKIIDFGISYQIPNNNGLEKDVSKYTDVGTGYYKAPELLLSKNDYKFEIDLWSVGIILMLLGSADGNILFEEDSKVSDLVLLSNIIRIFGSPPKDWEDCKDLDSFKVMNERFFEQRGLAVDEIVPKFAEEEQLLELMRGLTRYESKERWSSSYALSYMLKK